MKYIIILFFYICSTICVCAHDLREGQVLITQSDELSEVETNNIRASLMPNYDDDISFLEVVDKKNTKKKRIGLSPYYRFDRTTVKRAGEINFCSQLGYYVVLEVYLEPRTAYLFEKEEGVYDSLFLFDSKVDLVGQINESKDKDLDVYSLYSSKELTCAHGEVSLSNP
ncbi:hypothetical protein [Thioclava sp. GXIMD4216]|uniref:hypothetical protein n=1 Tax=Thioclava sp. GXIMD4216 TaxID=3131929 RepID=UPI0030D0AE84